MTSFNAALAILSGAILFLGVVAGYVKNRLWLAESLICMLIGIGAGPEMSGLLDVAVLGPSPSLVLQELARVTLGIAVMGVALRLPARYEVQNRHGLFLSLVVGLPLMWLTGATLAAVLLGLPLLMATLVGAILAPTDPVVANSISGGKLAEANVPARIRHLLTCESGANDGIGLMLVLLPVLMLQMAPEAALAEWLVRIFLW